MNPIQSFTSALEETFHRYPSFLKLYSLPYTKIVKKEVELAGIRSDNTVLNIGCGGLPFTSVKIAEMTGAKVYAMDNNKQAILSATKLVDKLDLHDKIKFIFGDGTDSLNVDFDKAVVALQARPQDAVVNNLIDSSNNASIVVRIPRKRFRETYGPLPDLSEATNSVKHHMITFDRSVLYESE